MRPRILLPGRIRHMSVVILFGLATSVALAHGCPGEMAAIDKALAAKPALPAETIRKIRQLRAEGERLHKDDKHGESMLVLGSAKKLLGID